MRLLLDEAIGETRVVLLTDGRPHRLIIERDLGPDPRLRLGARVRGRLRKIAPGAGAAFVDLGVEPDAHLPISAAKGLAQGAAIEVEITAEPRADKGPSVRLLGPTTGAPALLQPGPTLDERLAAIALDVAPETGSAARETIDAAIDEALMASTRLPGGGLLTLEPTRALTAVDVDFADAAGDGPKAARRLNLLALGETARRLRLMNQGGLVAIDLIGAGQDGEAIRAAAKAAFAPDQPGVVIGPVSRFGVLELARPWRERPVREVLNGPDGRPSALTLALALIRQVERVAVSDPGARVQVRAAPEVVEAATPWLSCLRERFGARFEVTGDLAIAPGAADISAK